MKVILSFPLIHLGRARLYGNVNCFSFHFLVAHFHRPEYLQDSLDEFVLKGIELIFITRSDAPGLETI